MALAFGLDRASKNWALAHLNRGDLHVFWPGLIDFDLITNTGAAFSVGHDQGDLMKYIALVFPSLDCARKTTQWLLLSVLLLVQSAL